MSGSNLTPFNFIPENSLATPGLWNSVFSTLSQNIAEANTGSVLSGGISLGTQGLTINVPSNVTDYIFLNDSANLRSSYVIGSFNTGTADGLNIWDASGQTMIVSFSKQSVRFYQQVIGPVFDLGGALTGTYNAATFGDGSQSTETRIQAAINAAALANVPRVYLPTTFIPYSASSISFIYTVQMVREGGDFSTYDVKAYGARGDGVTDDGISILAAESCRNAVPSGGPVKGIAGQIYLVATTYAGLNTTADAQKLMQIKNDNALWDFSNATIKYGGAVTITNGSDSNGLGVVNVLGNNVTFRGVIDCNQKAKFALAILDTKTGTRLDATFVNSIETAGFWSALIPSISSDLKLAPVGGGSRALNTSGFLKRPNCPRADNTDTITGHGDVTAVLMGGNNITGNNVGCAQVTGFSGTGVGNAIQFIRTDIVGVPQFVFSGDHNTHFQDIAVHDVGCDVIELDGTSTTISSSYSVPQNTVIGATFKLSGTNRNGAGWWYGNAGTDASSPNVWIDGGTTQGAGLVDLNPLNNSGSTTTSGGRLVEAFVGLTDAATIATDASLGNDFLVTLTASGHTVGAPTNPRQGQRITHFIRQDSTGGRTLLWNSVFHNAWSNAGNAANKTTTISHVFDSSQSWIQVGAQSPYV